MLYLQHQYNNCTTTLHMRGFDYCTTPSQQLHNNSSHEDGLQSVGPTLM
jgi:hypothetical protein